MKIDFYIPKDQMIPTQLRVKVDGTFEHRCTDKCIGGVKKWLKQPYKEENT